VIFGLFIFISITYIIKFSIYFFSQFFFCLLGLSSTSLIRIIAILNDLSPPQLIWISESLLYNCIKCIEVLYYIMYI
jgi:hypothetical protein